MSAEHDLFIIGHGLAGSVLATVAQERGLRVRVFDVPRPGQASRVAAGLVNPIVMRRMVPSWRAAELLPIADAFYPGACWHRLPMARVFADEKEEAYWDRCVADPTTSRFLSHDRRADVDQAPIDRGIGYGLIHGCAWLDVSRWLDDRTRSLNEVDAFRVEQVDRTMIDEDADHVRIAGERASFAIWCDGPFTSLDISPVRGESLTLRIPELRLETMLHRGAFILPLGDDLYRVGATYAWDKPFEGATAEGRTVLLERLRRITAVPVEVVDHQAGVRPAARDRRPLLGKPSGAGRMAVFNGLGSRGVLLAPWCAQHLLAHLFDGLALDPEVDVARLPA